ncbi:hypothetical protein KQI84_14570 [bacterium]|nr:hypothetical protein [bacterium]
MNNDTDVPPVLDWKPCDAWALAVFALLSTLTILPLFLGGEWFASHEMAHALVRLSEFSEALWEGQIPPRWAGNLHAGFGYPLFNFFPPLSFFPAEFFHTLGFPITASWKLELVLARFLGIAGMYFFLRTRLSRAGAMVGAILFAAAHYHAITLYVRGNLQEFTALNLWPWAFFGVEIAARRSWRSVGIVVGAIALAAVALCHVLTAYMLAFAIGTWSIFLIVEGRSTPEAIHRLLRLACVAALALGLSAFFILPALLELKYVQSQSLLGIQLTEHLLYLRQLFTPLWGQGISIPGPDDTMTFALGWALWAAVGGGALLLILKRQRSAFPWSILALFIFCVGAMLQFAAPLWRIIPASNFLQFPWRLLIPASFFAAALGGWLGDRLVAKFPLTQQRNRIAFLFLLGVPPALTAPFLTPVHYWLTAPEYGVEIERRSMSTTDEGDYLPVAVLERPHFTSIRGLTWKEKSGSGTLIEHSGVRRLYLIDSDEPGIVFTDTFWFPGWHVRLDGKEIPTEPTTEFGVIGWQQPAGLYELELRFESTPVRRVAGILSLLSLVVVLAWIGYVRRMSRGMRDVQEP